ncbi:MAG: hypothetical protein II842_17140 [Butyrivibrio sp.]|nr:hypothetical protein [Butyrivibrio sp.]
MKNFTVPMAIVDFIPVLMFTIAAIMLQRDLYNKMSKGAFALFAAGTIYQKTRQRKDQKTLQRCDIWRLIYTLMLTFSR